MEPPTCRIETAAERSRLLFHRTTEYHGRFMRLIQVQMRPRLQPSAVEMTRPLPLMAGEESILHSLTLAADRALVSASQSRTISAPLGRTCTTSVQFMG